MTPHTTDDIERIGKVVPFTQAAFMALQSGSTEADIRSAGLRCGLTRQGTDAALRRAKDKVRSLPRRQ